MRGFSQQSMGLAREKREHIVHSRRAAIVTAILACAAPLAAQAQPAARKARIAFFSGGQSDPVNLRNMAEPLRQGLRELGWVEGQNLTIEFRWADAKYERLPGLLDELLRLEPDALVTVGPRPALLAKDAVKAIPVVAVAVDDPVQMGQIASYTRPGGNITGITVAYDGILQKRLQLLKDIVPAARRFAIWGGGSYLDVGGLVSYQGDWPALFRRSATLVDKILKGAKPGEIPFEQGTKLELVVDLKGARAIGVTIPQSVLVSADEVIG